MSKKKNKSKPAPTVDYDRTCSKSARCGFDECKSADCEHYDYNHKRFKKLMKALPVALTQDELNAAGDRLVRAREVIAQKQEDLDTKKQMAKAEIKEQEGIIDRACILMRDKVEDRDIECEEVFDYVNEQVILVRCDTGEVLSERELSETERQMELNAVTEPTPEEPEGEEDPEAPGDLGGEDDSPELAGDELKCAECGKPVPESEDGGLPDLMCPDCQKAIA